MKPVKKKRSHVMSIRSSPIRIGKLLMSRVSKCVFLKPNINVKRVATFTQVSLDFTVKTYL